MKYIKQYETLWFKNLIIGNIYKLDTIILADANYSTNIAIGRIIDAVPSREYLNIKTFLKGDLEERILIGVYRNIIKRKATPEEIIEFEAIEQSKKYNL